MSVIHHLPEELLLRHAAGDTDEAEALLCACHLSLCSSCRCSLSELEAVAGELLARTPPTADATSERLLDQVLRELDAERGPARTAEPAPPCPVLPAPLTRYVGPLQSLQWKTKLPGVQAVELPVLHAGSPLRLKRLAPGLHIPAHGHVGTELELVLDGGATDGLDGRHFGRGDVVHNEGDVVHDVRIDDDGACIVLGITGGRLAPRGLWSHLVFGWLRW